MCISTLKSCWGPACAVIATYCAALFTPAQAFGQSAPSGVRLNASVLASDGCAYELRTTGATYNAGALTALTIGGQLTEGANSWRASVTLDPASIAQFGAQFSVADGAGEGLVAVHTASSRVYQVSLTEENGSTTVDVSAVVNGASTFTTQVVTTSDLAAAGIGNVSTTAARGEVLLALALTHLLDQTPPVDDDPNYTTFKECLDAAKETCTQSCGTGQSVVNRPCIKSINWTANPNSCSFECQTQQECCGTQ